MRGFLCIALVVWMVYTMVSMYLTPFVTDRICLDAHVSHVLELVRRSRPPLPQLPSPGSTPVLAQPVLVNEKVKLPLMESMGRLSFFNEPVLTSS